MGQLFANNAKTKLVAGVNNTTDFQLNVSAGEGDLFPITTGGNYFVVTVEDAAGNVEIWKVDSRASGSDVLSASSIANRAQEGTTKRAFVAGDIVECRLTKQIIEDAIAHVTDPSAAHAASAIAYAGSSGLAATDVEAALDELDTEKASLDSPVFLGNPRGPTASPGDNDTSLATTAFVAAAIATAVAAIVTFPAGTKMLFIQTAAPTGWTKDTTHNDKALRVVSGAASSGGSVAFATAFASKTPTGTVGVSGTVGGHALTLSEIPSHAHTFTIGGGGGPAGAAASANSGFTTASTDAAGSGGAHTHSFSGSGSFTGDAINLAVQYVDAIIATKN